MTSLTRVKSLLIIPSRRCYLKPLETVRLDSKRKNYLSSLKRITKIKNWNILCRWGFFLSLANQEVPSVVREQNDGAIEMTWRVFAGHTSSDLVWDVLKARLKRDGVALTDENMRDHFQRHLYRGINMLRNENDANDLIELSDATIGRHLCCK